MKIKYQCEICNSLYDLAEEALACEAQGIPDRQFHKGEVAGPYEIRAYRVRNVLGRHGWVYDVRTRGHQKGIFNYAELTEQELLDCRRSG